MTENTDYLNIMDNSKSQSDSDTKETDRLKKFEGSLHYMFDLIALGISYEKFKQIFASTEFIKKKPSAAVKLHKILKSNIKNYLVANLTDMIADADLQAKFQELSQIIEKNSQYTGKAAWRPTGNVEDDLRSCKMVEKLKLVKEFEKTVLEKEAEVDYLVREVNLCREKANSVNTTLDSLKEISEKKFYLDIRRIEAVTEALSAMEKS